MVFNQRILILDDGTKLWFPTDEEFDEFFTNEDEYENDDEYKEEYEEDDYYDFEMSDEISEVLLSTLPFFETKAYDYQIDKRNSWMKRAMLRCVEEPEEDDYYEYELNDEEAEEVLGSVPVFEKGVHDHEIDEINSWRIYELLRCREEPELVCLALSLSTCSFLCWEGLNVGFVMSNLKHAIRQMYMLDEEEFDNTWGSGRMRELINNVSELIYSLRYKPVKCDNEEIEHTLVNKDGGEFAYTLFANIFANKVFNPYDTSSFDHGNPRSVDYYALVHH